MWLSAPDIDWWWISFFAWIPLFWACVGQTPRWAFVWGLAAGVSSVSVGFYWLTDLMTRFAGMGIVSASLVLVLYSLYQGLQWALSAGLMIWLQRRTGWGLTLLAPLCWGAVEVALPNVLPVYIAMLWSWHPLWIQGAELGGAAVVGVIMVAINGAAFDVVHAYVTQRRVDRRALIWLTVWLVGTPTYGAIRIAQVDAAAENLEHRAIGIVQGNFGIRTRRKHKAAVLAELQRMSAELERQGAEIVVWGETAYPSRRIDRNQAEDYPPGDIGRLRKGFRVPLVTGAITRDSTRANRFNWNSAIVLDEHGRFGDRYDKNYPLLFGEYVPFVDPEWYLKMVPNASYLNRGDGPGVLRVDGVRFGALICYEDLLPHFARETVDLGVNVLLNVTNDSWFGKTREQGEHLALASLRAVETRRPLLRAVNAGASAYVDPVGRIVERTRVTDSDRDGYEQAEGFVARVPMVDADSRSVFSRTGHAFAVALWLALLGVATRRRRA